MIRLYPEQLTSQLKEELRHRYLLSGNDPLLHQESQLAITSVAKTQGFTEQITLTIDNQTDWQGLFLTCQSRSLFSSGQILILVLPDNGVNAAIAEKLQQLAQLLHNEILLIVHSNKISKTQERSAWLQNLFNEGVMIPCQTPDQSQLARFITQRVSAVGLTIDPPSVKLLSYYYEGNLLALTQTIEKLALHWPEGELTLPRIEHSVDDAALFSPFHWVDALLAGKSQRALHILHQLQKEGIEPVILLRSVQKELMLLLELSHHPLSQLRVQMDKLKLWQNRRGLYTSAYQRLTRQHLSVAIKQLCALEITLKQDFSHEAWFTLETLTLLLCQPHLPVGWSDV